MCCIDAEVEDHQGQEDHAYCQEDEGHPSPEADIVLQPVDVFGVVFFQAGDLGDVLTLGFGELLPEGCHIGFRLGGSEFCCGELQICGCQLLPDFGRGCRTGVIQRGKADPVAADCQQGVVNVGDGSPLEILNRIGKILVDGCLADHLVRCRKDSVVCDLLKPLQFLVEGSDGSDIAQGSEAWAVTGYTQIITGEAIPISRKHVGRFRG